MGKKFYAGDDVMVKEPGDIGIVEGYEGAFCECGCTLLIKTPDIKDFYHIVCPRCRYVSWLFCGKQTFEEYRFSELERRVAELEKKLGGTV
jgi:hypothetical protein